MDLSEWKPNRPVRGESLDDLRLPYLKDGKQYCPTCNSELKFSRPGISDDKVVFGGGTYSCDNCGYSIAGCAADHH